MADTVDAAAAHGANAVLEHTAVAPDTVDGAAAVAPDTVDGAAAVADAPVQAAPPDPVVLGPKTFPTAEHCFRYFSGMLSAMTCHQDCNEYERLVLEPLLMRGHPSAALKVGSGVRAFQVREHPEHGSRCFFVVRADGSAEDFSYRKCAEALFPGSAADSSALRRGERSEGSAKRGRGSSDGAARTSARGATRGGSFGSGGRTTRKTVNVAREGGGAGRGGGGGRSGGGVARGRGARGRGRGRR